MKLKTIAKYISPVAALAAPFITLAQSGGGVSGGLSSIGDLFPHGGLSGSLSTQDFIANIIQLLLLFAGIIAVVFIIIGGYQYITSAGNAETAEKGRNTMVNAIIGIVVIILSYVIINVIVSLVGNGRV